MCLPLTFSRAELEAHIKADATARRESLLRRPSTRTISMMSASQPFTPRCFLTLPLLYISVSLAIYNDDVLYDVSPGPTRRETLATRRISLRNSVTSLVEPFESPA